MGVTGVGASKAAHRGERRAPDRLTRRPPADRPAAPPVSDPAGRQRFRSLDEYRVQREWDRYEGTAQRELFRELRARFLRRHPPPPGIVLEIGPGPGRFTPLLGGPASPRLLVDLSSEMLRRARAYHESLRSGPLPAAYVIGDAVRLPIRDRSMGSAVLLGNPLGFAGGDSEALLDRVLSSLVPEGTQLIVEGVAASGERANYLARLPATAVRRLLRSPTRLVLARLDREGFRGEPQRRRGEGFRRTGPPELADRLTRDGWRIGETLAVAPVLGADPERLAEVRRDPLAWSRLVEIEETVGRAPARLARAAAYLLVANRVPAGAPAAPRKAED